MAFTINAYSTVSENNRVEKVFVFKATFTGTLREPCSIIRPEIVIERATIPTNWTHLYIQSWERWYFINNIVSVGKNLIQLSCSVDVLETYHGSRDDETMLYGCTGIVARNENASDPALTDARLPIQNNINMNRITATAVSGNTWESSDYVLNELPTDTGTRYIIMYGLAGYDANGIYISSGYPQAITASTQSDYAGTVKFAIEQSTTLFGKPLTDFVLRSYWLPFSPSHQAQLLKTLKVPSGTDITFTDNGAPVLSTGMWSGEWKATIPTISTYRYKNFPPYRDVFVEFLPFGRIKLDNAVLFSNNDASVDVYFKVKCNPATGDAYLTYYTDDFPEQFLAQSNVAINLPFTGNMVNYGQIAGSVASSVVSAAAAVGSAASGNYMGAISAGANALGSLGGITNAGRSSSVGALSGGYVSMRPVVFVYDNTVNAYARNNNLLGMPLYESKKMSDVYGYAEITNIHLDGFAATAAEKTELMSILADGVVFDQS